MASFEEMLKGPMCLFQIIDDGIICDGKVKFGELIKSRDIYYKEFNRNGVFTRFEKNLEKRPFTSEQVDEILNDVEAKIYREAKNKDIKSSKIGQIVMSKLKKVDKVAYIRFAAVYREFADLDDFKDEIRKING